MNTNRGFTVVELLIAVVGLALACGWIWNIAKIVHLLGDPVSGMFIFRCIGVLVVPLGGVLGYFP